MEILFHELKAEIDKIKSQKNAVVHFPIPDMFWIEDRKLHEKEYKRTTRRCCFNHVIGLPLLPHTLQPMNLMPYQVEFHKLINNESSQRFHINKARQIGATEIILRELAFGCFNKYCGGKILIIAGTRLETSIKIMLRLKKLFKNISWTVASGKNRLVLKLVNGTEIEALPSNSYAIRGDTKIKAVFLDEAAHFNRSDDSIVMDAIAPIIFSNKSDLFLVSTPNGRRGFFYQISAKKNDYIKIKWDYTVALDWIYSNEDVKKELQRMDIDVEQEYKCKFMSNRNAAIPPEIVNYLPPDRKVRNLKDFLGH